MAKQQVFDLFVLAQVGKHNEDCSPLAVFGSIDACLQAVRGITHEYHAVVELLDKHRKILKRVEVGTKMPTRPTVAPEFRVMCIAFYRDPRDFVEARLEKARLEALLRISEADRELLGLDEQSIKMCQTVQKMKGAKPR